MYSMILDHGVIVRDSDTKVVAPCQSDQDPDFVAYIDWVNAGNQPTNYNTYDEYLSAGNPPFDGEWGHV